MNFTMPAVSLRRLSAIFAAMMFAAMAAFFIAPPSAQAAEYDVSECWSFTPLDDSTAEINFSTNSGTITDMVIPSKITSKKTGTTYTVTSLAKNAFNACSKLKNVTIPSSVKSIGDSAFYNVWSLETVTFEGDGLETIGSYAFYGCEKLSSISLPDNLKDVGEYTFYECKSLSSISLPSTLESIGYKAFISCSALETVDFSKCTALKSIGEDAFNGCSSIKSLSLPEGLETIGIRAFTGCTSVESVFIPSTVTTWGGTDNAREPYGNDDAGGAFKGCTSLKTLTLAEGLRSLGPCAFKDCTSLTGVTLPSSLETLYYGVFKNCASLTSIVIPDSVTTMYGHVFEGCTALEQVTLSKNLSVLGMSAGDWKMIAGEQFYGCTALKEVVIPASVERLGYGVFYGCNKLETITFEGDLEEIDALVFNGCSSLANVKLPDSVTRIGSQSFSGCSSLTSFTFPASLTSVGTDVFVGCTSLESIVLPSVLSAVPTGFLQGCASLKTVTVPGTVTIIGNSAFVNCTNLETIIISEGVTTIERNAFAGCTSLKNIVIPSTVTSIGADSTFLGCSSLETIVIPEGVTSIGDDTFKGCSALKTVVLPSTITSIGSNVFSDCNSELTIYAPKAAEGESYVQTYAKEQSVGYADACHVTFDAGKGSAVAAQNVVTGQAATKPQNPTLSGYIFKGWQLEGKDYDFESPVETDITLIAVWERDSSGDDSDSGTRFVFASKMDVELPAIKAGDELPTQAAAVFLNAKGDKIATGTAQLAWMNSAGEIVEAGSIAQAGSDYTVTAMVSPQAGTGVLLNTQTAVSINGMTGASTLEMNSNGKLSATYTLRAAGDLGGAVVSLDETSFAYTGNAFEPQVTVTLDGKVLEARVDYEVAYSSNTKVGAAKVTITGAGVMSGQVSASFKIVPAKVKGVVAKAASKGKVKVSWAKHKAQTTGFEVRYGTSKAKVKTGNGVKTAKAKGAAKKAVTLKGLKSGKRAYVQVRAYKVVDGKTYRSAWSKVASVKVK